MKPVLGLMFKDPIGKHQAPQNKIQRMKKLSLFLGLVAVVSLASCYKDKGNYDYTDINNITIQAAKDTINVLVPDSLRIDITLQQTKGAEAGLSFRWVLFPNTAAPLTRRTIGTSQNLRAAITEDPGTYLLDLFVKDEATGVEYQKRFVLGVLTKFSEGWVVVEEKASGCDLHMITPLDVVFRNIYSEANKGQLLPPGTSRIPDIKTNRNIQSVYILSPNDGIYVNFANFIKVSGFNDFFFQPPASIKPQEYFMNGDDERMLNDGKPCGRNLINAGNNKLSLPPVGNYYMAPFELFSFIHNYIFYDTIAQRFYRQDNNNYNLLDFASDPADPFNMNKIDKRLLYAETNTSNTYYAFFKNNNDDSLFAYNFSALTPRPPVSAYLGLDAPGMSTATKFVLSRSLPYLYYASNNQLFKLDILSKTAAPLYTFPAGTSVRVMKMYRNLKVSSDPNNNKLIAVATLEPGNEGKVYYFPISSTGNFQNNTYSKVFTGFGTINELTFKSLK